MTKHEVDIVHEELVALIDANRHLSADELANIIQDEGYIDLHYSIAAQIVGWTANQAAHVLDNGNMAESVAHVPGEQGRQECVDKRDEMLEEPVLWLHKTARSLE